MRKTSPIPALSFVALILVCAFLFVQNRRDAASLHTMRQSEQAMRDHYGLAVEDIAAIQDSLNAITLPEGGRALSSSPLQAERQLSPTHGDEALARVSELRAGIERARDRITRLESHLRESSVRVTGLLRMVTRLKEGLAAKENMVAALSGRVDSLQTHVAGLTATVEQSQTRIDSQAAALEDRRRELGTVYCAVGTRQELLRRGVVVARGGLFGLGKTLDPSGNVDESICTAVDTDQQTVIPIPAAHARVLSAQPAGSYTLELADGRLELRILDAREFRKVRHLVILTV